MTELVTCDPRAPTVCGAVHAVIDVAGHVALCFNADLYCMNFMLRGP